MKNYTLITVLCSALAFSSYAQSNAGLKAGVNVGGFSGYDGGRSASIHAGLYAQVTLSKQWRLQPELLWSQTLQRYQVEENEVVTRQTLSVHFASVPLMLKYTGKEKFYLEAGPQFSFVAAAKDEASGVKADVKRSLRSTDIALNAGAGWVLAKRVSVYIRYSFGLTDMTRFDTNNDATRNLQAGIAFSLK